jgi:hypothetical protein
LRPATNDQTILAQIPNPKSQIPNPKSQRPQLSLNPLNNPLKDFSKPAAYPR